MSLFLPKRFCWFAEVPEGSYETAEPAQKTEAKSHQELAELSQQVEASQQTPETAQEAPEGASKETVKKALERDEKNVRAVAKLEGSNPTEGMIKMKLVEQPTTRAYIEKSDHKELQDQFLALQQTTKEGVREALRAA
ncbi:MAG: hypothetical protein AB7J40_03560 [Candidatus Altimarinota bacterium]